LVKNYATQDETDLIGTRALLEDYVVLLKKHGLQNFQVLLIEDLGTLLQEFD
jgi:hypothetical protein